MINRWVAHWFAYIVAGIHILVIGSIVLSLMRLIFMSSSERLRFGTDFGMSPESMTVTTLGILTAYIILMGAVSTLISINRNLERLIETTGNINNSLQKDSETPLPLRNPIKPTEDARMEPQLSL